LHGQNLLNRRLGLLELSGPKVLVRGLNRLIDRHLRHDRYSSLCVNT